MFQLLLLLLFFYLIISLNFYETKKINSTANHYLLIYRTPSWLRNVYIVPAAELSVSSNYCNYCNNDPVSMINTISEYLSYQLFSFIFNVVTWKLISYKC